MGVADQLEHAIQKEKNKPTKPSLFGKLEFGDDTKEAFNAFEAEYKLRQMETEIREMFVVGAWANLGGEFGGMDGYRKFCEMRRKIRAERIRLRQEQEQMQQDFWDNLILWGGGSAIIGVGIFVIYLLVSMVIEFRG